MVTTCPRPVSSSFSQTSPGRRSSAQFIVFLIVHLSIYFMKSSLLMILVTAVRIWIIFSTLRLQIQVENHSLTPLLVVFIEELGKKLEVYVKTHFPEKVRLVRLKERHGLIRARTAGAKEASGEVIIFLDSHCEANHGWYVPCTVA